MQLDSTLRKQNSETPWEENNKYPQVILGCRSNKVTTHVAYYWYITVKQSKLIDLVNIPKKQHVYVPSKKSKPSPLSITHRSR
jgi:hypothetical protein